MNLTRNAQIVLESRYLLRGAQGEIAETPEKMLERVAQCIADVEDRNRSKWCDSFFKLMDSRRFIPNSPTLMNAGKEGGQLSACFVLPVEDSLEGIFTALKNAAQIHQSGGGTGFSFSRIRPAGSEVQSSHGVAAGPVAFMRIFDLTTEVIKQGGARRGANMGILRVDHPDIEQFIESKLDYRAVTNFNISVGVTDAFMARVRDRAHFDLLDPSSGCTVRTVEAYEIFRRICETAWKCGDPGLIFLDRIGMFNPTPHLGQMESTNPCGEQPLLPYESCNLGSLNLGLYFRSKKGFDWELFREDIHLSVRFLDNVIDANTYPIDECRVLTLKNRKIGLGVMGFADLLLMLHLPYDSVEARSWGERVMSFVDREAKRASAALARQKGSFKSWKGSLWQRLGYPPLRNSTVSTVAPTGTISLIAGASSGIEPIFSAAFRRHVLDGKTLTEVHPAVERLLGTNFLKELEMVDRSELDGLLEKSFRGAWRPAWKIRISDHVAMQAAFQRHSDSAVSKTINLHESASVDDVSQAYWDAYLGGCKGITIYRDQSRPTQVLREWCPVRV